MRNGVVELWSPPPAPPPAIAALADEVLSELPPQENVPAPGLDKLAALPRLDFRREGHDREVGPRVKSRNGPGELFLDDVDFPEARVVLVLVPVLVNDEILHRARAVDDEHDLLARCRDPEELRDLARRDDARFPRLRRFELARFDLRDLVYFALLIGCALFANAIVLELKKAD